jgi:hypothetical protein
VNLNYQFFNRADGLHFQLAGQRDRKSCLLT